MENKGLYIYTLILFILLLISTFVMLLSSLIIYIDTKIITPLIILMIIGLILLLITIHYYKCLLFLKNKPYKNIIKINKIIITISLINIIAMTIVFIYPFILGGFNTFQIYFLVIDILSILYFIHGIIIDRINIMSIIQK